MASAAHNEFSIMKPTVVPSGDGQGLRHDGSGKRIKVDLRRLNEQLQASYGGMGGSVTALLPGMAESKHEKIEDLGEVALKGQELLGRDGRQKIDVLMDAGLSLRSPAVAAAIVALLQTSGRRGRSSPSAPCPATGCCTS